MKRFYRLRCLLKKMASTLEITLSQRLRVALRDHQYYLENIRIRLEFFRIEMKMAGEHDF